MAAVHPNGIRKKTALVNKQKGLIALEEPNRMVAGARSSVPCVPPGPNRWNSSARPFGLQQPLGCHPSQSLVVSCGR